MGDGSSVFIFIAKYAYISSNLNNSFCLVLLLLWESLKILYSLNEKYHLRPTGGAKGAPLNGIER